jgi:hypothetical protein
VQRVVRGKSIVESLKKFVSNVGDDIGKNQSTEKSSECNCRNKNSCPLSRPKCLTSSIVYQETVTRDDTKEEKTYV